MPSKKEMTNSLLSAAEHFAKTSKTQSNMNIAKEAAKTSKLFIQGARELQRISRDAFDEESEKEDS